MTGVYVCKNAGTEWDGEDTKDRGTIDPDQGSYAPTQIQTRVLLAIHFRS